MPEGPEARTVGDKLRPYLLNTTLTALHYDIKAKGSGFDQLSLPCTVSNVAAYGKKVLIVLSNGDYIITSLGMTGRLQFTAGKHSHVCLSFTTSDAQNINLYFDDSRPFGSVDVVLAAAVPAYFASMGPDLLQCAINKETWISSQQWLQCFATQRPSTKAICNMLEDQHRVAGMGWYIITETLYYAGIHPERQVQTITTDEWDRIRINAHRVIVLSYCYGGFTIRDYISPDGVPGTYPAAIYGKAHDPLGNVIQHKPFKNGRTIHYVNEIQH